MKKSTSVFTFILTIALLGPILTGCGPRNEVLRRLADRGPVPVSSSNPYLAANVLLSEESSKDKTLGDFLNSTGVPEAIEVDDSFFGETYISLYYPESREEYVLERLSTGWLITGPARIPSNELVRINSVLRAQKAEEERVEHQGAEYPEAQLERDPELEIYSAPPVVESPEPESNAGLTQSAATPEYYDRLESIRLKAATPELVTDRRGDIVHSVSHGDETLELIVLWYTDDLSHLGTVARINQVTPDERLRIGTGIKIPSYLLKNKKMLSRQVVRDILHS